MLPDMSETIEDWTEKLVLIDADDNEPDETGRISEKWTLNCIFDGVLIPDKDQEVIIHKEGLRNWKFWVVYTKLQLPMYDVIVRYKDIVIDTDKTVHSKRKENIKKNGLKNMPDDNIYYRVMSCEDRSSSGFYKYRLRECPISSQQQY